jgi:hypothetical protein
MFFPSIDCITLPPPSDDAIIMRNIADSEDKLSPQFKAAVPRVIDHIFSNVKPKTGYTTGRMSRMLIAQSQSRYDTEVRLSQKPAHDMLQPVRLFEFEFINKI